MALTSNGTMMVQFSYMGGLFLSPTINKATAMATESECNVGCLSARMQVEWTPTTMARP